MIFQLVKRIVTATVDTAAGASAAAVYALPGSDESKAKRVVPIIAARRIIEIPLRLL